jgi:hypothetical protein
MASTSSNLQAVAWLLSGIFGIVCVTAWIAFDVPEKISNLFSGQRPALGSLSYVNLIVSVERHPSGNIDVQLSVELTNTNDFLIKVPIKADSKIHRVLDLRSE